ncbi:hypothetical protein FMJ32_11675 [Klebsiella michiganensis]|uniref:hypothetical protein n=1 Tax=Enterobacterales TaxID=91347 RepID=UPI001CCB48DA|nr:hypothetical protein [Klebsiella michiganensis]MBZ7448221.1 hypothetical protein [Klebsiella michiganensis]HBR1200458.1 hypothetical protein [Klebsiella pneumoniae]
MTGGEFKAGLFLASISEKLLSREISEWSKDRKFNFAEIVNFQAPRPPANIRPQRIEQAGGSRKNFAAPASKKARPRAVFCGGLAPHTVKPGNISRPSGGYYRSGATNPFKAAFRFFRACEEK